MKRTRMRTVSKKRRAGKPEWDAVYAAVDRRSRGRCEVVIEGIRCRERGTDRHHCRKPRASNHEANLILRICRAHHGRVDAPYMAGRLVITPIGFGAFHCCITTAVDKFSALAMEG